eukprot:CAMPEP_0178992938 /NCGR_PEP_ID=MMETSP0795-20121207/6405_1 /TAXON_ID=88552 /ORGANISM="Amoebophrya sp., Strain Ameob2" /LENGTH=65 /DNA_ID=CAMNT_0020684901 /DNA_START=179 /DNA_END=376 /DNA_ORIENTATION=+
MQEQKRFISASTAKILIGAAGASLMAIQLLLVMILVNHFLYVDSTEVKDAVDMYIALGGPSGAGE